MNIELSFELDYEKNKPRKARGKRERKEKRIIYTF
jgi:hypothetical protein